MTNLVGNVVTHTPAGTPVRITAGTVGPDGAEAVLTVEDEGPGLTAEQAPLVFERFYRVDASRSRDGNGGAGLGLAIVHLVVTAHHGRVDLRTAPRDGTVFRIVLPALAGPPPDGGPEKALSWADGVPVVLAPPSAWGCVAGDRGVDRLER